MLRRSRRGFRRGPFDADQQMRAFCGLTWPLGRAGRAVGRLANHVTGDPHDVL